MDVGRRVALSGMVLSAALAAMKISAGTLGHSHAVVADGFESAGDVLASGLVFLGLTIAAKPADFNHPYGHGRAETLTGLLLGFILIAAGIGISLHSYLELGTPVETPRAFAAWTLVISIGVKFCMASTKYHFGRKIGSAGLVGDAYNDGVDMLSAAVALAALSLTLLHPDQLPQADRFGALAVGVIVVFTGLRVTRDTSIQLMDTMPDENMMQQIRSAAYQIQGVEGIEKCFARKTGLQYHVELHVEVDPEMSVLRSHDIACLVRDRIRAAMNSVADVLVHVEPSPIRSDWTKPSSESAYSKET